MAATKKSTPKKKTGTRKTATRKTGPARKSAPKKKPVSRASVRKKKTASRYKRRKKQAKPLILEELKKNLLGILILLSVCLTLAMVADIFFEPGKKKPESPVAQAPAEKPDSPVRPKSPEKAPEPPAVQKPVPTPDAATPAPETRPKPIEYEVFTDVDPVIPENVRPKHVDKTPRIAIIIDDIGYDSRMALALFELDPNITFSVLPFSPKGASLSSILHEKGAQVMLHLPMEPVQYPRVNPGPGAILSAMSPDELIAQLRKDLKAVPHAVGVNNHMGSRLTASSSQMNQIFTILKKENLFFIDSRTAPRSQGRASARLLKIRFAQRDVFLDNFQNSDYITGQLKELIGLARKHGSAIGIGHPYRATLETLAREIPKLKKEVRIVRASDLTHIQG